MRQSYRTCLLAYECRYQCCVGQTSRRKRGTAAPRFVWLDSIQTRLKGPESATCDAFCSPLQYYVQGNTICSTVYEDAPTWMPFFANPSVSRSGAGGKAFLFRTRGFAAVGRMSQCAAVKQMSARSGEVVTLCLRGSVTPSHVQQTSIGEWAPARRRRGDQILETPEDDLVSCRQRTNVVGSGSKAERDHCMHPSMPCSMIHVRCHMSDSRNRCLRPRRP